MVWTPKSTAPANFSLADAFIALITGDPTWGWLIDWATLVPNLGQNTAEFCAGGPPGSVDLSPILTPGAPDRNPLATAAKLATIAAALTRNAQDRVFGAFCQNSIAAAASCSSAHDQVITTATTFGVCSGSGVGATATCSVNVTFIGGTPGIDIQLAIHSSAPGNPQIGGSGWINVGEGAHTLTATFSDPLSQYVGLEVRPHVPGTVEANMTWTISWSTGFVWHTPTDQPEPSGAISPIQTVAPTLEGIATELERQEFKLDTLMAWVQSIGGATLDLGGPVDDPVDFPVDAPVEIVDAVGCVITVSGIPDSRALDFGTPQNVVRLGHVNFGTATAWFPSIWLTHTPMCVRPLPPGTTRVTITSLPPGVSAQIAMIQRNK